jgi:hypothetical protein
MKFQNFLNEESFMPDYKSTNEVKEILNEIGDKLKNPKLAKFFKNSDKEFEQNNLNNLKTIQKTVNDVIISLDDIFERINNEF